MDFSRDFWISSQFQSGFLDFKVDSRGISGFQVNFWISKRISGFHLNRYYSKIQLKYTHDSSTAFFSACMLTEYKVTGTSSLHSAQAACSLSYIYAYCDHKYSACSLLIHNVVSSPDPTLLAGRRAWAGHEHT